RIDAPLFGKLAQIGHLHVGEIIGLVLVADADQRAVLVIAQSLGHLVPPGIGLYVWAGNGWPPSQAPRVDRGEEQIHGWDADGTTRRELHHLRAHKRDALTGAAPN